MASMSPLNTAISHSFTLSSDGPLRLHRRDTDIVTASMSPLNIGATPSRAQQVPVCHLDRHRHPKNVVFRPLILDPPQLPRVLAEELVDFSYRTRLFKKGAWNLVSQYRCRISDCERKTSFICDQ
ncbi:uncharacterized protein FFMR_15777 [Fusarium fujikuroi]|nr:uncharacterized protein FFE2_15801 [Fusarium fujikuroi]SCO53795.1 uncharacterized protein FFNC_15188 [Fusarium fujikuroi]SCO58621.1 uncharacterized protein FFMR_15777 [Fusarium fujikuroi]